MQMKMCVFQMTHLTETVRNFLNLIICTEENDFVEVSKNLARSNNFNKLSK